MLDGSLDKPDVACVLMLVGGAEGAKLLLYAQRGVAGFHHRDSDEC